MTASSVFFQVHTKTTKEAKVTKEPPPPGRRGAASSKGAVSAPQSRRPISHSPPSPTPSPRGGRGSMWRVRARSSCDLETLAAPPDLGGRRLAPLVPAGPARRTGQVHRIQLGHVESGRLDRLGDRPGQVAAAG